MQSDLIEETIIDDKLTIYFDKKDHLVDTIVQFKKSSMGIPKFKLSMCCNCCDSRLYWFPLSKIITYGSSALQNLAK